MPDPWLYTLASVVDPITRHIHYDLLQHVSLTVDWASMPSEPRDDLPEIGSTLKAITGTTLKDTGFVVNLTLENPC